MALWTVYLFECERGGEKCDADISGFLPNYNAELEKLLQAEAMKIVDTIKEVIERTPPEMMEEISNNGIYLTGGGSKLFGIDKLIKQYTGINVFVANEPEFCVAKGTGKALLNKNFIQ